MRGYIFFARGLTIRKTRAIVIAKEVRSGGYMLLAKKADWTPRFHGATIGLLQSLLGNYSKETLRWH
jgi:hypothetical protein